MSRTICPCLLDECVAPSLCGCGCCHTVFPPARGISVEGDKGRKEKKVYDRHQGGVPEESGAEEFFNFVALVLSPLNACVCVFLCDGPGSLFDPFPSAYEYPTNPER